MKNASEVGEGQRNNPTSPAILAAVTPLPGGHVVS